MVLLTGCIVAFATGAASDFTAAAAGSSSFIVGLGAGFSGTGFAAGAAGFFAFFSLSSRRIAGFAETCFAGAAETVF